VQPGADRGASYDPPGGGLAWPIGHRVVAIGQLVAGLVELATVLGVILLVERWSNRSQQPPGQPVG
jgi:hypothetical protein